MNGVMMIGVTSGKMKKKKKIGTTVTTVGRTRGTEAKAIGSREEEGKDEVKEAKVDEVVTTMVTMATGIIEDKTVDGIG